MIGRTLARPSERGRPPASNATLEVGAVSELLGIARFKFHEGKVEEYKALVR